MKFACFHNLRRRVPAVCAGNGLRASTDASRTRRAAATKPPAMSDDAKKAKAKECSTQADAKGLHGKARGIPLEMQAQLERDEEKRVHYSARIPL